MSLDDAGASLTSYIKLRGSTQNETVYFQYDGDIVALVPGREAVPLVSFRGITKSHWKPSAGGGYVNRDYDVGVFVDPDTGVLLKTWRNPLTQETVDVIHYVSGPTGGELHPGKKSSDPYGDVGGRWGAIGDNVWQTSSTVLSWANPLSPSLHPKAWSGPRIFSSMSTTYAGRVSEVLDASKAKVASTLIWNDVLSPHPWMRMGARSVFCDWRMIGAKAMTRAELDPDLVREVEQVFPGYITRDAVWTARAGGWNQYRDRFPQGEV